MNTENNKNSISGDELQIHISYIESVLENYKKQLADIQKSNPDFREQFIPDSHLEELSDHMDKLGELEKVISLLPRITSDLSLLPSYEYVTGMRDCLSGATPDAIRLLTFLAGKDAYSLEQKLMASMELKGERLVEATDTYNKERNLLSNRAIDKEKFLKKTALEKKSRVIKLSNSKASTGGSVKDSVAVGDKISFGNYPQEEDGGSRPIEWRVLDREGEKALLISRYALDCVEYHDEFEDTTWEDCTLRAWLNDDFIEQAFSEDESKFIAETTVTADENPEYDTDPGSDTTDKVFLLSIPEAEKYFKDDEDRRCVPTAYAVEQGAWTIEEDGFEEDDDYNDFYTEEGQATCWWWLRSLGHFGNYPAYVDPAGSVYADGNNVYSDGGSVRPALWINL